VLALRPELIEPELVLQARLMHREALVAVLFLLPLMLALQPQD
jgi:hypothetical protein